jgi:hypothetical protein
MRKDLVKPSIKSSFLACEKDTETILRKLFIESRPYSDTLKKLLAINTKDCLTATGERAQTMQQHINTMNLKTLLDKQYIRLQPKITFNEHEEVKSYILISFDNFTPNATNPEYRDCTVAFDIVCHTDYWELNNFQQRPLKIVGYIDGILNDTRLSGIGKFHFMGCKRLILNEDLSGYTLMYRAVHDVDGDDKIPAELA